MINFTGSEGDTVLDISHAPDGYIAKLLPQDTKHCEDVCAYADECSHHSLSECSPRFRADDRNVIFTKKDT